ncbi:MAG: hypothetical protein BWY26_01117 [Elusimicrobia bacterium ADurb.Bin231]|nr:MAG: hypothetical protein BWY26_01117 [Elusimicrobia bacterium ADurb.Bin231]
MDVVRILIQALAMKEGEELFLVCDTKDGRKYLISELRRERRMWMNKYEDEDTENIIIESLDTKNRKYSIKIFKKAPTSISTAYLIKPNGSIKKINFEARKIK